MTTQRVAVFEPREGEVQSSWYELRPVGRNGGLNKGSIRSAIFGYGAELGISLNIMQGFYEYILKNDVIKNNDDFTKLLFCLESLGSMLRGRDLSKARSFNYISEDGADVRFEQMVSNAEWMVSKFGVDFFARNNAKSKGREKYLSAKIPGTDANLTCIGGTSEGAFSIAFGISVDENEPLYGRIWHTGFDTERDAMGNLGARIIMTSNGVKSNDNVEEKLEKGTRLYRHLRIPPERALTFLCMHVAYDMGATKLKALSTLGATELSLLGRAHKKYDYTAHFRGAGFEESQNPRWLEVANFRENFYDALMTHSEDKNGLRAHETDGLHAIFDAFQNLRSADGKLCPLTICAADSRVELEKALRTYRVIHGKS